MDENSRGLRFRGTFGHTEPLGNVDHTFVKGRVYALTGPNGCGKSTLLYTLAGQLAPLDGGGTVDGDAVTSRAALGKIELVDAPRFLPDLSISEHFDLIHTDAQDDVDELVELWALEDLIPCPPSQLSSGQRQRVFLALQMIPDVEFVLFDEPERHLDADWVRFLAIKLRVLADRGPGVIVATHSPVLVAAADEEIRL